MILTVPHNKSRIEAMRLVEGGADRLFAGVAGPSVEIVEQKREWIGSTMQFSFVGRMGFVSVPLNGTIVVGDENVILHCELPLLVQQFIGDSRIGASIEKKVQLLLQ